jgi:hypothetical protein
MLDRAQNGDTAAAGDRGDAHQSWAAPAQAMPGEQDFSDEIPFRSQVLAFAPSLRWRRSRAVEMNRLPARATNLRSRLTGQQLEFCPMPLKARVGRHTRDGGRQCQNLPDDQSTVINLLIRIRPIDGGAAGGLGGPVVAGYAATPSFRQSRNSRTSTLPTSAVASWNRAGPCSSAWKN